MTEEPETRADQPEVEEVVDAGPVSATDPAPEVGESAEATVESDLNALVEEARSQRDEYLDLAQRTKADFENYRKRMAAESKVQIERGRLEVVSGLIEAVDNLERVLEAAGIERISALEAGLPEDVPVTEQGVIVAYRDLIGILARAGVEAFDSKGQAFDPNLHEALQALPAEGVEAGVVIEEMQKGYRAGENVIRHARVVVSQ